MVEFMRGGDVAEKAYDATLNSFDTKEYQELRKLIAASNRWQELGSAFYDSGYLGLLRVIDRDYFISNFDAIFSYIQTAGTFEAYIGFFKALFAGENTDVQFTIPSPATLRIDVATSQSFVDKWITNLGEFMVTNADDNMVFSTVFTEFTIAQTKKILQFLAPLGIVTDVNIVFT